MPKPTQAALVKKPAAVIIQQFKVEAPEKVALLDFEWFENDDAEREWFDVACAWAREDVNTHGDVFYVYAEVTDTAAMTLGNVMAYGPDGGWETSAVKAVQDDPQVLVAPPVVVRPPKPTPGAKVKGRAPSAAKKAVKGPVEETAQTPVPKQRVIRKKVVADPKPIVNGSEKRATALKARLSARKAAEAKAAAPAVMEDEKVLQPSV